MWESSACGNAGTDAAICRYAAVEIQDELVALPDPKMLDEQRRHVEPQRRQFVVLQAVDAQPDAIAGGDGDRLGGVLVEEAVEGPGESGHEQRHERGAADFFDRAHPVTGFREE